MCHSSTLKVYYVYLSYLVYLAIWDKKMGFKWDLNLANFSQWPKEKSCFSSKLNTCEY